MQLSGKRVLYRMAGLVVLCLVTRASRAADAPAEGLPADWLSAWQAPPADCRPLQIVHHIDPSRAMPEGLDQILQSDPPERLPAGGMRYYQDLGLGGVVCNVAFDRYLRSDQHWESLVAAVRQCAALGLSVWLYDEKGYPSGAAGGLVLEANRDFEAQELAFDAAGDDPFLVRPAYEHTHASNNYHAARRYPNLLDDRAARCFVQTTHAAYWQRLEAYFGTTIQAAFTDEPSLIAVNIGRIPAAARARVPVVDPVDESLAPLPRVPWCYDLPDRYRQVYGEDLLAARRSLFTGDAAEDRKVRRQYWQLVADLIAERYFGTIQDWCSAHRIASSGHTLWEEAVLHHVPLEGNALQVLERMDIPGLDMLSSDPQAAIHGGWLTAALPASAARLNGGRRVMTEISDFSQKQGGAGPAGLAEMQAAAAWQAAWDVTEFTLYYGLGDRPAETTRAYCDFVGRLNAVLKPAQPAPSVLLYYPIYDLWSEYLPVAEPLQLESQSPRAREIVASFSAVGRAMQRQQLPFTIVDHRHLAAASVDESGRLVVAGRPYEAVVIPAGCELPASARGPLDAWQVRGGAIWPADPAAIGTLAGRLSQRRRLDPPSDQIVLGRFERDEHEILLLVNVGGDAYRGRLEEPAATAWTRLDPATGAISTGDQTPIELPGRGSILLVRHRPR